MEKIIISGKIADIYKKEFFNGVITVENGIIADIKETDNVTDQLILPGFVDSHIHIESSMLTPYEFSRISMESGVISVVADPHEIANVMGIDGINFMIESADKTPMKIYFGVPSCVPASPFETSGSKISPKDVENLLQKDEFVCLAEMMNFPGIINQNENEIQKVESAKKSGKPIDGHIPGVKGDSLKKYIDSGISTDHECNNFEEAKEKLSLGMKILIREGSAAKDFENLIELINSNPDEIMFCSDDLHPDNLISGHINLLIKRAIEKGFDFFDILKAAHLNPKKHYNLKIGSLQKGDTADFVIVDNLKNFQIKSVFCDGNEVVKNNKCILPKITEQPINNFQREKLSLNELEINLSAGQKIPIIRAFDGSLFTKEESYLIQNDNFQGNQNDDILKIVVINRYNHKSKPAVAFIKGFELKNCAIASSVAHDSHNIVAVGTNDELILNAINMIISEKGGLSFASEKENLLIPLKIAGIISDDEYENVARKYQTIDKKAKQFGTRLTSPFMTLAFMCLTVIPEIKISDKGLFDSKNFGFIN